ncbi:caspase family protein [Hugenholtzia roseola]|uniref:caspase family protein n=1 Tax=Hugenholtzia roseola TaxID=1002 RepID=UPI0003FDABC4|nr:caspase family protein [Hugenholtzia roseola]
MKRFLFFFFFYVGLAATSLAQQQYDWYVILAAATKDRSVGVDLSRDYQNAANNFKAIAQMLGYQLHLTQIEGDNFTAPHIKQALQNTLQKAKSSQNHRIVTFFSLSHGMNFEQATSELSYLVCNPHDNVYSSLQELLSSQEILETLHNSGAFESVHVWVEACNSIPRGSGAAPSKTLKPRLILTQNPLHDLLTIKGYTVMNAASYGQYAFAGVYSYALWAAIEQASNGQLAPDWEKSIFPFIKKTAETKAVRDMGAKQNPICYLNKVGGAPNVVHNNSPNSNPTPNTPNQQQGGNPVFQIIKGYSSTTAGRKN